jgi:hypothetical protein
MALTAITVGTAIPTDKNESKDPFRRYIMSQDQITDEDTIEIYYRFGGQLEKEEMAVAEITTQEAQLHAEMATQSAEASRLRHDHQDRMINPILWKAIELDYGPFSCDALRHSPRQRTACSQSSGTRTRALSTRTGMTSGRFGFTHPRNTCRL